ncbi:hypothetical protein E4V42_01510 [Clostridium estertheticum]|uniref:Uncharacterized protein n=1 Tax=Clostridium estertheticum TaxID=238834 RepID=A0A5N7III7_9CLOT|nr:hypothetical protein [Clostridium estertheticum]MPQ30117.1 hypothetical protein [Clostridium estertheticum]MPQ60793.1 hypothetical protein [Clostridium estertheticum]
MAIYTYVGLCNIIYLYFAFKGGLMNKHLRIHGDNIVECERILKVILFTLPVVNCVRSFASRSCMSVCITTASQDELYFELFPGFNKNTSDRWDCNILDLLTQQGSFLDETPDAILTEVSPNGEIILIAIEFCSALQAGNQAWQRSGRAYSTSRTKLCPFIYIVDFVKYELNAHTRERKALRFPNPAVPFSYISHSKKLSIPVIQAYFRSEEFQPSFDNSLQAFDTSIFSELDVSKYLIELIYGIDTTISENTLLSKNYKMVEFISRNSRSNSFSVADWSHLYNVPEILAFSKRTHNFNFRKKISVKSISGHVKEFIELVASYSIGIASSDLPFGLIPAKLRKNFITDLAEMYNISNPKFNKDFNSEKDLIVCILKGFKPGGDDNRPDRGLLPFVSMLTSENVEMLTFIYGPINKDSLNLLDTNIIELARRNGFWRSFVSLSNYIVIDAPLLLPHKILSSTNEIRIINNNSNKDLYLNSNQPIKPIIVPTEPNHYSENDVDTLMHTIFKYLIPNSFEGLCNPPGGDWSGISIIDSMSSTGNEFRWLSLPRVSQTGKRPDHVVTLDYLLDKPIILTVESKEKARKLESNIGHSLKNYISYLFNFNPSVEKKLNSNSWNISNTKLNMGNYYCASVGCFLAPMSLDLQAINSSCACDIIIAFEPCSSSNAWNVKIEGFTPLGIIISKHIIDILVKTSSFFNIIQ